MHNTDVQRDDERDEWNAALASDDDERIEQVKDRLLNRIHTRIMNDDPNYVVAGWTSG